MATISAFRKALSSPIEHFRTIPNIVWNGCPIVRSTYFAECRATLAGCPVMLFMPLTRDALLRVERLCTLKKHLTSQLVPQLTIIRQEMRYNTIGEDCFEDILLEPYHLGNTLSEYLNIAATDNSIVPTLLTALDTLKEELQRANLSLNNVRAENLILDSNNTLRPIRWYYATEGAGGDDEAFNELRTKIASVAKTAEENAESYADMMLREPDTATYNVVGYDPSLYINHLDMTEGLIAVETHRGWGFIDCDGNIVIEPQYGWASQFCEGRAEVETADGMGLINKRGEYIILPEYNMVDYDHITGNSLVNKDDCWALFNYSGEMIEPFSIEKLKI